MTPDIYRQTSKVWVQLMWGVSNIIVLVSYVYKIVSKCDSVVLYLFNWLKITFLLAETHKDLLLLCIEFYIKDMFREKARYNERSFI